MSNSANTPVRSRWLAPLCVVGVLLGCLGAAALGIYWGLYNVAADEPHSQSLHSLLETVRDRSIAVRATDIDVPTDLSEQGRIASGAGQYVEMCASCHLAPGMKRTEISRGLYPRAPQLRRGSRDTPAEDFWVVKHGIKATGMPAWGVTHSDKLIWDLVAFLRLLPDLSAEEYEAIVESAPNSHDEIMKMEGGHGGH